LLTGAGTVGIDTATLAHTGGTIVANGALQLTGSMAGDIRTSGNGVFVLGDGGTSGSFTGNLVNDGTFIYARSDSYSLVGDFSGSGRLEKRGAGVLTFAGDYQFLGTTSILGGSVKFTGQIDPTIWAARTRRSAACRAPHRAGSISTGAGSPSIRRRTAPSPARSAAAAA
jgi:autotransporter-associated beta strand protein